MPNYSIRVVLDGGQTIEIHGPADITEETTDAIVNAANSYLMGGGGVDGAIHDAAGPTLKDECWEIIQKIKRLPAGQAVITSGGRLAAKHVIHTVGPVYARGEQNEAAILASCYRESLRVADENVLRSISFPAISTGVFGYPEDEAAPVALSTIIEALASARNVALCRFILYDRDNLRAYQRTVEKLSKTSSSFHIEKAHS